MIFAPMTAAVLTVGCRLNQAESDCLRGVLRDRGFRIADEPAGADVVFVNTCTVTGNADRSSMALIRRVCRLTPKPRVVVLGCLAERAADSLTAIPGVDEVWSNQRKQAEIADAFPLPVRSRALLKVQDGCDQGCRYCVVSLLRGTPVSLPPEMVQERLERLVAQGVGEVVLTGLNLGKYSVAGVGLAGLIASLLKVPGRFRLRLASLEPDSFDERLFAVIGDQRICPHFHIPLQSGDEKLLAAMGRNYTSAQYARLIERLLAVRPDANIGTDVIVGFPGEDSGSFERTKAFLERLPIAYLHVFPYSPRPGTLAVSYGDPVPREVKAERVALLLQFARERRWAYARRFNGTVREAVLEPGGRALTDNYLRLFCPELAGVKCRSRHLVRLRIEVHGEDLLGRQEDL